MFDKGYKKSTIYSIRPAVVCVSHLLDGGIINTEPLPASQKQGLLFFLRPHIGWVLSILLPLLIYFTLKGLSAPLPENSVRFIAIIALATVMWMFRLTHAFVPALLILLLTILFDVAPREVAFSGFTSEAFFLCLGIFIMAAQVFSSGLLTRFSMILLRILPRARFSRNLILFLNGGLLSMVLPSPVGRAALLTPLTFELIEDIPGVREKKLDLTPLIVSLTQGATLLSVVFLIGNPLNLILLDLAGNETKIIYGQWLDWFVPSEAAALVLILGWLLVMLGLSIGNTLPPIDKEKVKKRLADMGPMTSHEAGAVLAILIFGASALTINFHHISLAWIAFGMGIILYLYDVATPQDLRSNVDWGTLLFIAALTSWQPILSYLKLDAAIIESLRGSLDSLQLAAYVDQKFDQLPYLILALTAGIILIRFLLPGGPTFIILMTALTPIVVDAGISAWALGFTILTLSEGFILSYQHGAYTQAMAELAQRNLLSCYNPRKLFIASVFLMFTRAAAVIVSFWYWRYIHAF